MRREAGGLRETLWYMFYFSRNGKFSRNEKIPVARVRKEGSSRSEEMADL